MTAIIPDVFCQVTIYYNAAGKRLVGKNIRSCGEPAVSPYSLCRKHDADRQRLMPPVPSEPTRDG